MSETHTLDIGDAHLVHRQYLLVKRQFPKTIIFMELGDFYNTFDDDAERVGTICKITVQYTSRATSGLTITGFPKNAALRNVAKLIEHGFQVALVQRKNDSRVDVKLNPYGG